MHKRVHKMLNPDHHTHPIALSLMAQRNGTTPRIQTHKQPHGANATPVHPTASTTTPPTVVGADAVFETAMKSIEYAESTMSRTKVVLDKTKATKDARSKAVSKASSIVSALLDPALQVANLLDGVGAMFPPCKVASNTLAGIVTVEQNRRDNDVRIAVVFLDLSTTLVALGTLKPGFEKVQTLAAPLKLLMERICRLMEEFGQFSEQFHDDSALKSKLKRLLRAKSNKDRLVDFREEIATRKADLTQLLSHQAVLMLSAQAHVLEQMNARLRPSIVFYASLSTDEEVRAEAFVEGHGGEDTVREDDRLLETFAALVGEKMTPAIRRVVKESAEEAFRQSQAAFMLKYHFALELKIDDSQEAIMRELKSGPHELIPDSDIKQIWKETAGKESSIKRRRFIDGMNYHFNFQFKKYKSEHARADRDDAWTRSIVSRVQYHPAIGDAIDSDASGYISVDEVVDFLRQKPEKWTVPQWVAYWAYGWDADNIVYQRRINQTFARLEELQKEGHPHEHHITAYLDQVKKPLSTLANSLYNIVDLEPAAAAQMDRMRDEWRGLTETAIKKRLKSINYRVEESSVTAIAGSARFESNFLTLAWLLLSRHLWLLTQPTLSEEDVDEAASTMEVLFSVVSDRILELKAIWRRQRMDFVVQIRYYANGMLEDTYKFNHKDYDTDNEEDNLSEWDEEDEWESEEEDSSVTQNAPASHENEQHQHPGTRGVEEPEAHDDTQVVSPTDQLVSPTEQPVSPTDQPASPGGYPVSPSEPQAYDDNSRGLDDDIDDADGNNNSNDDFRQDDGDASNDGRAYDGSPGGMGSARGYSNRGQDDDGADTDNDDDDDADNDGASYNRRGGTGGGRGNYGRNDGGGDDDDGSDDDDT
ncbi:hypothetical protein OF83DRAFT_1107436 [Amylostereum chailletii]|nr:hypothetical protein OF83DRAFT_1107436 [Amylostereum chailletii]